MADLTGLTEDERIVMLAFGQADIEMWGIGADAAGRAIQLDYARTILAVLAERGRLLPPGGEVGTQWMIRNADGVEGEHTDDERAIRQSWAQGITWWDPDGSYELCRCTFTVWPDGTEYIGPWEVVERHPVVPDDSEKGAGDGC